MNCLSLFFQDFHSHLVKTLQALLKPTEGAFCWIIAPRRGDSLDNFLAKAKEVFNIERRAHDEVISKQLDKLKAEATFDADSDEPLFIVLTHKEKSTK